MRARRGEACSARGGGGAGGWGLSCISVRAAMVDFDNVKEGKRRSSRVAEVQKAEEQRRREEAERRRREEEEAERRREERKRKAAEREAERARKKARRAAVYEDDDDGAGEADGPDGEDDDGEDGEPEDCETNLRRAWEFAAVVHWCRIFGDSMRLPKFQSADLETALQQPAPAQVVAAHGGPGGAAADGGAADGGAAGGAGCVEEVYVNPLVSELVLRLVKSGLVSEREHRELLGDWEGKLFRKLERYRHAYELLAVFPQGNPMRSAAPGAWLLLSPLQRVRVLYLLCILRCDECALVRDAVKRTVDNAEYTADALRNEPVGVDDRGRRYYTFAHMGEDCYLYREKRPAAGREGGRVRWETVATTMEEVRALADGFRGSSSRNERRLHEYLTAYHIPQLEETELERERQQKRVERQLEISLMPRKRSSRIAASSSRKARSAHWSAPAAWMPSASVGWGSLGACTVSVATRSSASSSSVTCRYFSVLPSRSGTTGSSVMPGPFSTSADWAARVFARSATASSNLLRGAMASTRPHSTARLPRMPSLVVQKMSARSRRTLRLSTRRVRPPVPGRTARSGTSGRLTALEPSSMRSISSQARASS